MEDREIDSLPPKARAAALAAAAEHVLDFYRFGNFSFQVKHAPGKVVNAPPNADLLEHALQLAWSFAEGKPPSDAALDAVIAGFMTEPSDASEDDMCVPGLTTLGMVEDVVRSLRDETPHHARRALSNGRNAIVDGLGPVLDDKPEARKLAEHEHKWQQEVLNRVRTFGDASVPRSSLRDLIERELPWRAHLPAYRDYHQ
jgi:hypothetical protein